MEEKYISLEELVQFMKKNYLHHVWKKGISKLYNMYPTYLDQYKYQYPCTDINIKTKLTENGNTYLEIKLIYPYIYTDRYHIRTLLIGKKGNSFFILSDDFTLEEQQKIRNKIDFTYLYNLYVENPFFTHESHFTGYYNSNGEIIEIPIRLNSKSINVGCNFEYEIRYSMKLNKYFQSEVRYQNGLELEHKIKPLYSSDPNFSYNLLLKYEDLPEYIQKKLYNNPLGEPESPKLDNNHNFQKIKQFFRLNS